MPVNRGVVIRMTVKLNHCLVLYIHNIYSERRHWISAQMSTQVCHEVVVYRNLNPFCETKTIISQSTFIIPVAGHNIPLRRIIVTLM